MAETRLTEMLGALTRREIEELELYVSSPAINPNPRLAVLFNYIRTSNKKPAELTNEELKEAVFGKKNVKEVYLRVLITGLIKIIEKFFIDKKLEEDSLRGKLYLIRALRERKCQKGLKRHAAELLSELEKAKLKDSYQYLKEGEFKIEEILSGSGQGPLSRLKAADRCIDLAYMDFKLDIYFKLLCAVLSGKEHKTFIKESQCLLKSIDKNINDIKANHILIYLKYLSLKMLMETGKEEMPFSYKALKTFLSKHENILPEQNVIQSYENLITFCRIKQQSSVKNTGKNENPEKENTYFAKEELSLYKKLLAVNPNRIIGANEFANIIDCALKNKEGIWAYNYTEQYSPKLPLNVREHYTSIAYAKIAYYERRFNDAVKYLSKLKNLTAKQIFGVNNLRISLNNNKGLSKK